MVEYLNVSEASDGQIAQITALYRGNNWWGAAQDNPELVNAIVVGSHCFILAQEGDRLVGMGRAISDGASDAYLQDVTVHPDFRGQGIGAELVRRLVERLHADGLRWIGVIAEGDSQPLYAKLGFSVFSGATPLLRLD